MPFITTSQVVKPMIFHVIPLIEICFRATLAAGAVKSATQNTKEAAMITRSIPDHAKALDAFVSAKFEIDTMLDRLKSLSADHFDIHPEEVNWGHVGTLNHYACLLRQITDSAFKECEHAA